MESGSRALLDWTGDCITEAGLDGAAAGLEDAGTVAKAGRGADIDLRCSMTMDVRAENKLMALLASRCNPSNRHLVNGGMAMAICCEPAKTRAASFLKPLQTKAVRSLKMMKTIRMAPASSQKMASQTSPMETISAWRSVRVGGGLGTCGAGA